MKAKLTNKQKAKKLIINFLVMTVLNLLTLLIVYKFEISYMNASNSIFIVNMISFAIAIILQTGATRLTLGLSYTGKTIFQPKKTKEEYETLNDYYEEKAPLHKKDVKYLIYVNITYIIIAFILAQIYLETKK